MSQIRKGIFGALAICLVSGAMQFAFGHDLIGGEKVSASAPETSVNRAAKADRAALAPATVKTETIGLKLDSLAETSIVIRVPVIREEARSRPRVAPSAIKPGARNGKTTLACEPVVSVLTEVAKLLQPGRCVT
jgi:hypothetical protein